MSRNLLYVLGVIGLTGCSPWDNLPSTDYHYFNEPLWDGLDMTAAEDGLYVGLPQTGELLRLRASDDSPLPVDLGTGEVFSTTLAPQGDALFTLVKRPICVDDDAEDAQAVSDCSEVEYRTDLNVIQDGQVALEIEDSNLFNSFAWSNAGDKVLAYIDLEQANSAGTTGIVSLTSVLSIDVESGESAPVSVGFTADDVVFSPDDTKALVLSRNKVAVLDMTAQPPALDVVFPLSLDVDVSINPNGVSITPDGEYALISSPGMRDLYVLDLVTHSVNLISLAGYPAAMQVDVANDQTVLVYRYAQKVEILSHEFFDVETTTLDETMSDILLGDGFALLHPELGSGKHDIYHLDTVTGDVSEYRLENPPIDIKLADSGEFAVALTRAESSYGSSSPYDSHPGMEILDLREPSLARSYPYLLEGPGIGLELSQTDTELYAMVLQQGVDYLYLLDLYSGNAREIELPAKPLSIRAMANGDFAIGLDILTGGVAFYNPQSDSLKTVTGFAVANIMEAEMLYVEDGE